MDTESYQRPRRTRHDSTKLYDRERKDLELTEVLDVLQRYVDYGGGINCCVCGKLYKSRVCFIKHLWEHTIYWDQFAGDKNHMRVLSIQAALILYGSCHQPLSPVPVDSLLVTSPHSTDAAADSKPVTASFLDVSAADKKETREPAGILSIYDAAQFLPTTPIKHRPLQKVPRTPRKKVCVEMLKRKAPPKFDLGEPQNIRPPPPTSPVHVNNDPSPLNMQTPDPIFRTPVKQAIPFLLPKTPRKKPSSTTGIRRHRKIRPFLLPTTDLPEHQYWKGTDSCACKRKRSE